MAQTWLAAPRVIAAQTLLVVVTAGCDAKLFVGDGSSGEGKTQAVSDKKDERLAGGGDAAEETQSAAGGDEAPGTETEGAGDEPGTDTGGDDAPQPTPDSENEPSGEVSEPPGEAGTGCGETDVPDAAPPARQLVITIPRDIEPCSVVAYVVGQPPRIQGKMSKAGVLHFDELPAGTHDVIVMGATSPAEGAGAEAQDLPRDRGQRLNDLDFTGLGGRVEAQADMPMLGTITGTVELSDRASHEGVAVRVPGTDFATQAGSDGTFTIAGVPAGAHSLHYVSDGYHRGQVESVVVQSATAASVGAISLVPSSGVVGFVSIENGSAVSSSRSVSLVIGPTSGAVLMQISESPGFEAATWVPIVTTTSHTFADAGDKTLYVRMKDEAGNVGETYSDGISVVIFPGGTGALGYAPQGLNAAGTSQAALASLGLGAWSGHTSGGVAKWYVGNVKTCASIGMRLPAKFETTTTDITGDDGFSGSDHPLTDGSPTFAQGGGPHHGSYTWTATSSVNSTNSYWAWNDSGSTGLYAGYSQSGNIGVRCVLP
jgi:hypothetical protein